MITAFELPAPGKLNRFLHITGRRLDGYHQLQTLFQIVDTHDVLTFEPAADIRVLVEGADIPEPDNLVHQAAMLLSEGMSVCGVQITINKNIPVGGGMGGGSSDAATALHGLNLIWGLGYSTSELAEIGLTLGADVPVFVHGRTSWAEGIGEIITPVDLKRTWFVVLMPGCLASTAKIFLHPELTRDTSAITIARFLQGEVVRNDCEEVAGKLYPEIRQALDWLGQWGSARMTGTGACVFLETGNESRACEVLASQNNWQGFVTCGVRESALFRVLERVKQIYQD